MPVTEALTLTSTDLHNWSSERDAEGHLPTLVRRLIMATTTPQEIRVPAAEGVRLPGFDGRLWTASASPPYVPAGHSVWELGVGADPAAKADADYAKRTSQVGAEERAETAYVAVTSRRWPDAHEWAKRKQAGVGWARVYAFDAEDLATWLESCPGVHGWLAARLGRQPWRAEALRDWFANWCEFTDPALPPALLLAGRDEACTARRAALVGPAGLHEVHASTKEEAIAFVGAILLADPPGDQPTTTHQTWEVLDDDQDGGEHSNAYADQPATGTPGVGMPSPGQVPSGREVGAEPQEAPGGLDHTSAQAPRAAYEAVLERAIVVHDAAAWRRLVAHERPLVLVAEHDVDEPEVVAAHAAGHHVVLPGVSRGHEPDDLPRLHRAKARRVWETAGLTHQQADEYAVAARRNMSSLRRRLGRASTLRRPSWSSGADARLLAPLLLAGAWNNDRDGDKDVVAALAGRPWRELVRDLTALAAQHDPPVRLTGNRWHFLDPVDAFDQLRPTLIPEDLDLLHQQVRRVLGERDPMLDTPPRDRWAAALRPGGRPARRHSGTLRRGLATTLAVLGAMAGTTTLPNGRTGQQHADAVVHGVLHHADADRWLSVVELLPVLAEAAPDVFLAGVDAALAHPDAPVMALFEESTEGPLGTPGSRHSPLLWALEVLGWSERHATRAAVLLARLADRDPGGRLVNRPSRSLRDALHPVFPQSAARSLTARLNLLDVVRRAAPTPAFALMTGIVRDIRAGVMLQHGPRWRDWPRSFPPVTSNQVVQTLDAVAYRLAEDCDADPDRWATVLDLVGHVPHQGRRALLDRAAAVLPTMPRAVRARVLQPLVDLIGMHADHPTAEWALDEAALDELRAFTRDHGAQDPDKLEAAAAAELFTWWPRGTGLRAGRPADHTELTRLRADAVRAAVDRAGLPAVFQLAADSGLPIVVGATLAEVTGEHDRAVLDLLDGGDRVSDRVAAGLVGHRIHADQGWLPGALADRPAQRAALLLAAPIDQQLLQLLEAQPADVQLTYWQRVPPELVPDEVAAPAAEELLSADRPLAAVVVLAQHRPDQLVDVTLAPRALRQLTAKTTELGRDGWTSFSYLIGVLFDRIDAAGVTGPAAEELAALEWYFLPVLRDRSPRALHRQLAADPVVFVQVVELVYLAADSEGEPVADPGRNLRLVDIGSEVLRSWRSPMPGSLDGCDPTAEQIRTWVVRVWEALAASGRALIAPIVIGEALSGPATDPDGTWPSQPVRDVLELEHNRHLEEGLHMGRWNQRGATVRGAYDGGAQERELAWQYRQWAERVRGTWDRSAVLLEDMASSYDEHARREDQSAELRADE